MWIPPSRNTCSGLSLPRAPTQTWHLGASPRASLALLKAAQALAAARGRDHVLPDDIKYLAPFTLTHRLIIRSEAELRGRTAGSVLRDILSQTPLPLDENSP